MNKIEKYFPFPEIRPQQKKAIEFTLNEFKSGKKFVILEMGVGCGKSATAVTISRYIQNNYKRTEDYEIGSWFLTTQKTLQEQYMRDFGGGNTLNSMKTIKSAESFCCKQHDTSHESNKLSCGEVSRIYKLNPAFKLFYSDCRGNGGNCRYVIAKQEFLNSLESVTNYSYFFAESNYAGKIKPRDLLVLDEAHNIEDQASKFIEVTFSERFAKTINVSFPSKTDNSSVISWIKIKYLIKLKRELKNIKAKLDELNSSNSSNEYQKLANRYDKLDKHVCKINRFLDIYDESNWVINIIPAKGNSMRHIEFKPVDVSQYMESNLFRFGNKILLMSATILDKTAFCKSLGIPEEQTSFLRLPSPFDPKNKPVYILPAGSMSKSNVDKTLPGMCELIQTILEQHKDQKGIIHATNFKIVNYIIENIKDNRLITHDSKNREQILKMHTQTDQPTVLISPSMSEGVDLVDNLSRFQILCKIPYPYLGDKVVKKRMENNVGWYDFKTMISIIQSFGRSIRSKDDHATSYVLDSDWVRFFRKNKKNFPDDFIKCLVSD
jgi:Rad3-related DNA helicase